MRNGRCGSRETISSRVFKLCSPWTRTFRVVSRALNVQRVDGIMVASDKKAEQGAPTMPLRSRRGAMRVQARFSADYETSTSTEMLSAFFEVHFIDAAKQTLLSTWISTKNVGGTVECLCCHWCGGTVDAREPDPPYGQDISAKSLSVPDLKSATSCCERRAAYGRRGPELDIAGVWVSAVLPLPAHHALYAPPANS